MRRIHRGGIGYTRTTNHRMSQGGVCKVTVYMTSAQWTELSKWSAAKRAEEPYEPWLSLHHEGGKDAEYEEQRLANEKVLTPEEIARGTIYTAYYDSETEEIVRIDGPLTVENTPARWYSG